MHDFRPRVQFGQHRRAPGPSIDDAFLQSGQATTSPLLSSVFGSWHAPGPKQTRAAEENNFDAGGSRILAAGIAIPGGSAVIQRPIKATGATASKQHVTTHTISNAVAVERTEAVRRPGLGPRFALCLERRVATGERAPAAEKYASLRSSSTRTKLRGT